MPDPLETSVCLKIPSSPSTLIFDCLDRALNGEQRTARTVRVEGKVAASENYDDVSQPLVHFSN